MGYEFSFIPVLRFYRVFLIGFETTLAISITAMALATVLAAGITFVRLSGWRVLQLAARLLVDAVRGIPALVLLIYLYYGISLFLGINIDKLNAAIWGLAIFFAAYLSEAFRAGILAVERGQIEAAVAIGMTPALVLRRVVLPQATKVILPPYVSLCISMLKTSALVSVLGVGDLVYQTHVAVVGTDRVFEAYTVLALLYLAATLPLSALLGKLEHRLRERA